MPHQYKQAAPEATEVREQLELALELDPLTLASSNNEQLVAGYASIQAVSDAIHETLKGKNWGWDYARMVREYFGDMYVCLQEMWRGLRPGRWALLVVGDQTCKGVMIPVTEILAHIASDLGFGETYVEQVRERRSTTHSMGLQENVLALRKPSATWWAS